MAAAGLCTTRNGGNNGPGRRLAGKGGRRRRVWEHWVHWHSRGPMHNSQRWPAAAGCISMLLNEHLACIFLLLVFWAFGQYTRWMRSPSQYLLQKQKNREIMREIHFNTLWFQKSARLMKVMEPHNLRVGCGPFYRSY